MSATLNEADIETLAIDWFRSLGYDCALGSQISPDGMRPLRDSVTEAALAVPLRSAIARLNPALPATAVEDVLRQALRQPTPSLVQNNLRFHQLLTDGVQVEHRRRDGKMVGAFARLLGSAALASSTFSTSNRIPRPTRFRLAGALSLKK